MNCEAYVFIHVCPYVSLFVHGVGGGGSGGVPCCHNLWSIRPYCTETTLAPAPSRHGTSAPMTPLLVTYGDHQTFFTSDAPTLPVTSGDIYWMFFCKVSVITTRKRSCGKVMFLHMSVSHSVHGVGGLCLGLCPGGSLWSGSLCERDPTPRTVTVTNARSTHPTGIHTCLEKFNWCVNLIFAWKWKRLDWEDRPLNLILTSQISEFRSTPEYSWD